MHLSPIIRFQPNILIISGKKDEKQLNNELQEKNSNKIIGLSISHLNLSNFKIQIPHNITKLTANMCLISQLSHYNYSQLIEIQMNDNSIKRIHFSCIMINLKKLSLNNNKITIIETDMTTQCPKLKDLNVYGNPIDQVSIKVIMQTQLVVSHQILDLIKLNKLQYYSHIYPYLSIKNIIQQILPKLKFQQTIKICTEVIQYQNLYALQILSNILQNKLCKNLIKIASNQKKYKIVGYLIKKFNITQGYLIERLCLMDKQLFNEEIIKQITLQSLIQGVKYSKLDRQKIIQFLRFLKQKQKRFIQSTCQLLTIIQKHSFYPQILSIIIQNQIDILQNYQFDNLSLTKQILSLDSYNLIAKLIKFSNFQSRIFQNYFYLKIMKPFWKTYRFLRKMHINFIQTNIEKKSLHFREYGNFDSILIKKNAYNGWVLKTYQQFQGNNFLQKSKMNVKLINKENYFSIAKKINDEIKMNKTLSQTNDNISNYF